MRFRKLRIAFSATWLVVCVLLMALWVRSYSMFDSLVFKLGPKEFEGASGDGKLHVGIIKGSPLIRPQWMSQHHPMKEMKKWKETKSQNHTNVVGFGGYDDPFESLLIVPFWFLCIASACCSAILWPIRPWRFSVRMLLIAITLVAVVLGLIAWSMR
jgi:hypothetical protein